LFLFSEITVLQFHGGTASSPMEAELRFAVHENKFEELCLELTRLQKEIEEVNQHKIQAAE